MLISLHSDFLETIPVLVANIWANKQFQSPQKTQDNMDRVTADPRDIILNNTNSPKRSCFKEKLRNSVPFSFRKENIRQDIFKHRNSIETI